MRDVTHDRASRFSKRGDLAAFASDCLDTLPRFCESLIRLARPVPSLSPRQSPSRWSGCDRRLRWLLRDGDCHQHADDDHAPSSPPGHNLRAAYLRAGDTLTSVLAMAARACPLV
jgi:hypothetical protein